MCSLHEKTREAAAGVTKAYPNAANPKFCGSAKGKAEGTVYMTTWQAM